MSHTSSSTEDLRFNDASTSETTCNGFSLFWSESDFSEWDSNSIRIKKFTGLILVKLDASLRHIHE